MKKHIPNLFTCGNLTCGCIGIDLCFQGNLTMAAYMMLFAGIFDFFDGFVARLLKVSSPMGKELDSLADMVTFGVLPGFIMMKFLYNGPMDNPLAYAAYVALLIPVFSALRLAKFNIDTRQSEQFIGVPTPANAFLIGFIPLMAAEFPQYAHLLQQEWLLISIIVVMSLLLVAELPMLSLKFKSFAFASNMWRYLLILGAVGLVALLGFAAIPLVIFYYIILSVTYNILGKGPTN
ncbi:CDP-diacylglycerol--serine O-phosphatidyltransferase [Rapidithrix thailandica]|uniref:CDP-diacylglycerol--serine O-phosphatidyltransferase n=1 Tax=Rapidithrix thailandica TaxID=413964 RepID=A0AAW9S549_9BACT